MSIEFVDYIQCEKELINLSTKCTSIEFVDYIQLLAALESHHGKDVWYRGK